MPNLYRHAGEGRGGSLIHIQETITVYITIKKSKCLEPSVWYFHVTMQMYNDKHEHLIITFIDYKEDIHTADTVSTRGQKVPHIKKRSQLVVKMLIKLNEKRARLFSFRQENSRRFYYQYLGVSSLPDSLEVLIWESLENLSTAYITFGISTENAVLATS